MANVIANTEVYVTSTGAGYTIPGEMSPTELVTAYSNDIPGLNTMTHTTREEYRDGVGNIRIVTFSPRTGTKG